MDRAQALHDLSPTFILQVLRMRVNFYFIRIYSGV